MNDPVRFGTLLDVSPRVAWPHEAHAFTPWLADNLDRLSESLGIPLELSGLEVGVGRYSADILATSPADSAIVLIENQLEPSDHIHLGQIMTYLAGLEAQVIIWLSPEFRQEHLSALRWLNQHTDERYSFFAVRLRVVQIGDSPLAPLFEVLEKPNTWDKSLQRTARAATSTSPETTQHRDEFWALYSERDPDVLSDPKAGPGATVRWRPITQTGMVASRYRSKDTVGIFLRGGRGRGGEVSLPRLEAVAASLQAVLGVELGNADFPFIKKRRVNYDDPDDVSSAIDWLIEETTRYTEAASRFLMIQSS